MRIRRLKLSGFKSFVEPSDLRIEPGSDGSRRAERMRQVEPPRGDPLGDGRREPEVASRRRHGRRHLRRHRDAAAARLRRSVDPASSAQRGEDGGPAGRKRGHSPDRARRRLRLPDRRPRRSRRRTCRCCSPTLRPAPIRRRWSARARSARSSPPSRPSGGCCSKKRPEFPACTRGARMPSRSFVRPRPTYAGLPKCCRIRSSALRRVEAAGACRRAISRRLSDKIRSAEARLVHARWVEADQAANAATEQARTAEADVATLQRRDRQCAAGAGAGRSALLNAAASRAVGGAGASDGAGARAGDDAGPSRHGRARLAELDRLDASLASDIEREEALRHDAEARIADLEAERPPSISALLRTRRNRRESAAILPIWKPSRAKPRPRSPIC